MTVKVVGKIQRPAYVSVRVRNIYKNDHNSLILDGKVRYPLATFFWVWVIFITPGNENYPKSLSIGIENDPGYQWITFG